MITQMNIITNEKMKSVRSINECKSVIQTNYDIVKAHGGEVKVQKKKINEREQSLLFIYQI
jgi:hypothetical protein